jgi:hypothetical protein
MANPYYENASRQKFEQRDPTQCVQEENVVLAFRPKEVRLACSDRYQQEGVRHDKQIAFLKQKQVGATSSLVARCASLLHGSLGRRRSGLHSRSCLQVLWPALTPESLWPYKAPQ